MTRLARRSGRAPDHLGLLLGRARVARHRGPARQGEPPGVVMRWDQSNTGTYRDGAEIVAVVSGIEFGRWTASECKHEVVTRCAVQGCDPETCDLSRCWTCGERR